jgi:hypothetical protein
VSEIDKGGSRIEEICGVGFLPRDDMSTCQYSVDLVARLVPFLTNISE